MNITETLLKQNITGVTKSGQNISVIDNETYYWDYRKMDFSNAGCVTDDIHNAETIHVTILDDIGQDTSQFISRD